MKFLCFRIDSVSLRRSCRLVFRMDFVEAIDSVSLRLSHRLCFPAAKLSTCLSHRLCFPAAKLSTPFPFGFRIDSVSLRRSCRLRFPSAFASTLSKLSTCRNRRSDYVFNNEVVQDRQWKCRNHVYDDFIIDMLCCYLGKINFFIYSLSTSTRWPAIWKGFLKERRCGNWWTTTTRWEMRRCPQRCCVYAIQVILGKSKHVWLSGRKQQTHNLSPLGHHRFKPCRMHKQAKLVSLQWIWLYSLPSR